MLRFCDILATKKIFHALPRIYFVHAALYLCLCHCWSGTNTAEVLRPRGVSLLLKTFYEPSKDFTCIDGSGTFPFYYVNDDYCDCDDGSDEPGTAACPNGWFHCVNFGYISIDIPSSRVNDKICDCCDGSDEYNSTAECTNLCIELGMRAKAAAQKQHELHQKGYQLFQEYSVQGKQMKENNKIKLLNLKSEEATAEKLKTEKEAIKNDSEDKEKAALAKYEALKEEEKREAEEIEMIKHQEEEKFKAEEAFRELDLNQDGVLTFNEIQRFPKFDSNHDGTVSDEEGKFFLHMKDSMELEEFVMTGWMIMKPIYMLDKIAPPVSPPTEVETEREDTTQTETRDSEIPVYEGEDLLDDDTDDEDDSEMEEIDEEPEGNSNFPHGEGTEQEVPEQKSNKIVYDEETQKLVDAANEARNEFKDASERLENIQNEIKQIETDIEADFGNEQQFLTLKGQCFDFDDREYTYRLCPFDRASQVPKTGGSDVSLGRWGHWAGPEDNPYSKMKFENGQGCWNGPARSTMVLLICGVENKILSASEPNRCEYVFELSTPALCSSPPELPKIIHEHTEL